MRSYKQKDERNINKSQGRIRVMPTGYVNYVNGIPI